VAGLSCHGKFVKGIPSILTSGPLTTPEIYEQIRHSFPECISEERCPHGGEGRNQTDYEWQHSVRRAQYNLKRKNLINDLGHKWYYIPANSLYDEAEEMEVENLYRNENVDKIREELRSISPKSSKYEKIKGIRFTRDRTTVAKLKILREFRCQICCTRIVKKDGDFYAEGAHIEPKRTGSQETPDNIIIMCPNHHKEFDLGKREIIEHNSEYIRFIMHGKDYRISVFV
jgi:predicted restriction endonuclease